MASLYVECEIHAPIERVWTLTQAPELHERWDLRFSRITYLPRSSPDDPQRFRYTTRLGFGLVISGEGETVGESERADGTRTSALKFGSELPISLIREGSGYWQYEPTECGTRFRTRYDYRVRFGPFGRALDLIFRPLLGWATAWSFDTLRLWAEREIPPELSRLRALVHATARIALAAIWLYHGLVPKLLVPTTGEREQSIQAGIPASWASAFVTGVGVAECLFGLLILAFWHARWLLSVQVPLLVVLTVGLFRVPQLFVQPFSPLTLHLAMLALAFLGTIAARDLPRADRCLRRPLDSR